MRDVGPNPEKVGLGGWEGGRVGGGTKFWVPKKLRFFPSPSQISFLLLSPRDFFRGMAAVQGHGQPKVRVSASLGSQTCTLGGPRP